MPALLMPDDAARTLARLLSTRWAEAVCAELGIGAPVRFDVRLRPGVGSAAAVVQQGTGRWAAWLHAWDDVDLPAGCAVERADLRLERVAYRAPTLLRVDGLDAAAAFATRHGDSLADLDLDGARRLAARLNHAGAALTPATLRHAAELGEPDQEVLVETVAWLGAHPEVSRYSERQLPIPLKHTKWLQGRRRSLVEALTGRDLGRELRPRPTVVHLTYLDPRYRATSGRLHDSWTAGDTHDLAYVPRVVVVVENRDCRLFFPEVPGAIAVEGVGAAAVVLLAEIPWLVAADVVAYWGDLDADGFAILDALRAALAAGAGGGRRLDSILMDAVTLHEFAHLRSTTDPQGRRLGAPRPRALRTLTAPEQAAYALLSTRGQAAVRRIEQEKLPVERARAALLDLVARIGVG